MTKYLNGGFAFHRRPQDSSSQRLLQFLLHLREPQLQVHSLSFLLTAAFLQLGQMLLQGSLLFIWCTQYKTYQLKWTAPIAEDVVRRWRQILQKLWQQVNSLTSRLFQLFLRRPLFWTQWQQTLPDYFFLFLKLFFLIEIPSCIFFLPSSFHIYHSDSQLQHKNKIELVINHGKLIIESVKLWHI